MPKANWAELAIKIKQTKIRRAMEDHSAGISMKGVEHSVICNGDTQSYANHWFPNSYGRKPAYYAERALQGYAECKAVL
jgi:hypothetical protein